MGEGTFLGEADAHADPPPGLPLSAPPPSPESMVVPPPGSALPHPPRRVSLADEELLSTLGREESRSGGALEAIEQLQAQLRIREQEAREFRSWESSMLAIGTPEALEVVEETRTTFTEVIQVVTVEMLASQQSSIRQQPSMSPAAAMPPPSWPKSDALWDEAGPNEISDAFGANEGDVELAEGPTLLPAPPLPSPHTDEGDVVIAADADVIKPRAFSREPTGTEPTMLEHRTGGAVRLLWLWFAANSSVLSVIFGALLLTLGMSLRQAIVATLAGVALSFLPLGMGTLVGKWNGQPTMIVSRATFGMRGNVIPTVLGLLTRALWGGVLLWFLASITAHFLVETGASGGLGERQLAISIAGVSVLIALVVAYFGYALLARVQLVLSILSGVLVILFIALTSNRIDIPAALTLGDGPWVLVLTGAILVFSFVGLVWSVSSGDLARYQRPSSSGAAAMLTAPLGSAIPAFVLIAYGAVLAASDSRLAFGFVSNPLGTLAAMVPNWFVVPLIAALGLGLLSGVILSIYTAGFTVQSLVGALRRDVAVVPMGLVIGVVSIAMLLTSMDIASVFRDLATTLAVPIAAWVGIFSAEIMIRNRRFNSRSLVQPGGVYRDFYWVNLAMLVVATVIGLGFTTATVGWLSWQGYLLELSGVELGSELARADVGVLVALIIGLITPIAFGIRSIRRQEAESNRSLEQLV